MLSELLGSFEPIEYYEYYDIPLLFVAKNKETKQYFLILLDEVDATFTSWLYLPISDERFNNIRDKNLSINFCFLNPEYDLNRFNIPVDTKAVFRVNLFGSSETIDVVEPFVLNEESDVEFYVEYITPFSEIDDGCRAFTW